MSEHADTRGDGSADAPHLRLRGTAFADLLDLYEAADGAEPCGYLLGTRAVDGIDVERVVTGCNVHPQPRHAFLLAPAEQLVVLREARERGELLFGFWHGHLDGPPRLSHADRNGHADAARPWVVIVGREGERRPAVRAWRRDVESGEFIAAIVTLDA